VQDGDRDADGLTGEQRALLASLDRLLDRHLPIEAVRRHDAEHSPPNDLMPRLAEIGLMALAVPEDDGGLPAPAGGRQATLALVQERLGRRGFMAAALYNRITAFGIASLRAAGSAEQRADWLPRLIAGTASFSLALTEPGAGSDAGALATRAVPDDGGGWRITGRKTWISGADTADRLVVAARTDPESRGGRGVGLFLVPPDAPGLAMTPLAKVGNNASRSFDIGFDGVAVTQADRLGPADGGFGVLKATLAAARLGLAAAVVGSAQQAVDLALAHAGDRVQFGRPVGAFQAIAHRLVDMQTEVDLARLMVRDGARRIDAGAPADRIAAQAKLVATETLQRVADRGMQILASAGYAAESDMQRIWRDARLYTFGEGSSEILRDLIGRDLGVGAALGSERGGRP
jgi:alkylation response protein AidB-like acyl-CoA dehydrogenase